MDIDVNVSVNVMSLQNRVMKKAKKKIYKNHRKTWLEICYMTKNTSKKLQEMGDQNVACEDITAAATGSLRMIRKRAGKLAGWHNNYA